MIWYFRYVSVALFIGSIIKYKQKQFKEALVNLLSSIIIMLCSIFIPNFMVWPFKI